MFVLYICDCRRAIRLDTIRCSGWPTILYLKQHLDIKKNFTHKGHLPAENFFYLVKPQLFVQVILLKPVDVI